MQPHAKTQLHLKRKLKLLTPVSLSSDSNPITEWGKKRVKKSALLGDFEVKARRLDLRVCRFEKLSLDLCCISLLLSTKSALHTNTHSEIRYENEFILKFTGHITLLRNPPSSPRWFVFGGCVCVCVFLFYFFVYCRGPGPANLGAKKHLCSVVAAECTQFIATAGRKALLPNTSDYSPRV